MVEPKRPRETRRRIVTDTTKHKRPSAAELDERVSSPLDPATTIEALLRVDAKKVDQTMPKRERRPTK